MQGLAASIRPTIDGDALVNKSQGLIPYQEAGREITQAEQSVTICCVCSLQN